MSSLPIKLMLTALVLGALAVPALARTAEPDGPPPPSAGERSAGAPGQTCREQGLAPGSAEFRRCVVARAQARGRAMQPQRTARRVVLRNLRFRRECRNRDLEPRSPDFRECVREQRRAFWQAVRERRSQALEECRDRGLEPRSVELRGCVRAELRERREAARAERRQNAD